MRAKNELLLALSLPVYQQLLAHSQEICLKSGQIVHRSNEAFTEVYFPLTAVFSATVKMADGSSSEVALIGKEGLVGLPVVFGGNSLATNSIVQISGTAIVLSTKTIQQEFHQGEELRQIILTYARTYIAHISYIAACNSLHSVEQRFARFLLLVSDCTNCETLPLTQKIISLLLGVRRASITETAISLQSRSIIQYSRGKIEIIDRPRLEAVACECYSKIKSNYLT